MKFSFALLALVGFVFATVGCSDRGAKSKGQSILSTVAMGLKITATVPSPASIQRKGNAVEVSSGAHKITVERERAMVGGEELTKLSADTKDVDLGINDVGLLTKNDKVVGTKQLP